MLSETPSLAPTPTPMAVSVPVPVPENTSTPRSVEPPAPTAVPASVTESIPTAAPPVVPANIPTVAQATTGSSAVGALPALVSHENQGRASVFDGTRIPSTIGPTAGRYSRSATGLLPTPNPAATQVQPSPVGASSPKKLNSETGIAGERTASAGPARLSPARLVLLIAVLLLGAVAITAAGVAGYRRVRRKAVQPPR